jgi:hypothetical protein
MKSMVIRKPASYTGANSRTSGGGGSVGAGKVSTKPSPSTIGSGSKAKASSTPAAAGSAPGRLSSNTSHSGGSVNRKAAAKNAARALAAVTSSMDSFDRTQVLSIFVGKQQFKFYEFSYVTYVYILMFFLGSCKLLSQRGSPFGLNFALRWCE